MTQDTPAGHNIGSRTAVWAAEQAELPWRPLQHGAVLVMLCVQVVLGGHQARTQGRVFWRQDLLQSWCRHGRPALR
jgi:hypothetical protein